MVFKVKDEIRMCQIFFWARKYILFSVEKKENNKRGVLFCKVMAISLKSMNFLKNHKKIKNLLQLTEVFGVVLFKKWVL